MLLKGLVVEVRGHVCRYDEWFSLDGEGMVLSQAYPSPTTTEPLSGSVSCGPISGATLRIMPSVGSVPPWRPIHDSGVDGPGSLVQPWLSA